MRGHTLSAFVKLMIFALVTVVATAILGVTISNKTFGSTKSYTAQFVDVTGLLPGDSVRAAGVRVGTVKSIKVVDVDGKSVAQVGFDVDQDVPITESTEFDVRYLNLVGQRYLAVVEKPGDDTTQPTDKVITIGEHRTAPALDLTQLFNGFRPLFQALDPQDVNQFSLEIVKTLQGEGGTITDLVAHSASLTTTVAHRDAVIGQVINNLLRVLDTVQQRDQGLSQLIDQLQRLVSGLAADRNTIAAALPRIDALAGNSASLLRRVRPYLPSDLSHLSGLMHNLERTKNCSNYVYPVRPEVDATKVPRFANNNCKGPNTLAEYLRRAPVKLTQIIRTATYGSFFNFYLCDLEMTGQLADVLKQAGVDPNIPFNTPACGGSA
jgi:phospholipid/cholesterol/gamma-HCH transport system substrate-binding protein